MHASIDFTVGAGIAVLLIIGVSLGARVAHKVSAADLQRMVAGALLPVGVLAVDSDCYAICGLTGQFYGLTAHPTADSVALASTTTAPSPAARTITGLRSSSVNRSPASMASQLSRLIMSHSASISSAGEPR